MKSIRNSKFTVLAIAILSLSIFSCSSNDDNKNINTDKTTTLAKNLGEKKIVKEVVDNFVVLTDLNLTETGVETFETTDDFSTKRLGSGIMKRKFDDKYKLHKLTISKNIYDALIYEGLNDVEIVTLMTPEEYIEALASCALTSKTIVSLKICVGITQLKC